MDPTLFLVNLINTIVGIVVVSDGITQKSYNLGYLRGVVFVRRFPVDEYFYARA